MSERRIPEYNQAEVVNAVTREALEEIAEWSQYARAGVLIAQVDLAEPAISRLIVNQGYTSNEDLVPIASMGKLPWVIAAATFAERSGISFTNPVELGAERRQELEKELCYVSGRLDIRLKPEISIGALIEMTLALSTNTSLLAIKEWLTESGQPAANFVQADIERVFQDIPGHEALVWAVTGSAKASQNGISNGATLREVLAYFQLLANSDPRLNLSSEAISMMHGAMRHSTDPLIELKARLWDEPTVADVFGKFGHDPYVACHEIPTLFDRQGLRAGEWLATMGSVERVRLLNGHTYDIGHYVTVPHTYPLGPEYEHRYEIWREKFANVIPRGLAHWLIESAKT